MYQVDVTRHMVKVRKSVKGEFLIVILAIGAVVAVIYETWPGNPSITVQVTNNGRLLQNITVSCFQCIPFVKDKWEGTFVLDGIPLDVKYYDPGSSVGIKFNLALASQIAPGSSCTGYAVNTTCVRAISLPFSFSFDIKKTSSGGYLQAIVYLNDGEFFVFPATSGGLGAFFDFQAG